MTTLCARCTGTGTIITPDHDSSSRFKIVSCPTCNGLGYIPDPKSIQIRDLMAAHAMTVFMKNILIQTSDFDFIAQKSYAMADAMIKARFQQPDQIPDEPDPINHADQEADQLWAAQPTPYDP